MNKDVTKQKSSIKVAMNRNGIKTFKICEKCNTCNPSEKIRCIKCKRKI